MMFDLVWDLVCLGELVLRFVMLLFCVLLIRIVLVCWVVY